MFFSTLELQVRKGVSSEGISGSFETLLGKDSPQCLVTNAGLEDAYVTFDSSPVKIKDDVSGTRATLVLAGHTIPILKFTSKFFAARTEHGETDIYFHAGRVQ